MKVALLLTTRIESDLITAGSVIDTVLEAELYADLQAASAKMLPYVGDVAAQTQRKSAARRMNHSTQS
jgi:hypothetical protein